MNPRFRRIAMGAVLGSACLLVSALSPSADTYAGWSSSAPQSQGAVTMASLGGVTFADSGKVVQPQATPAAKATGYMVRPTSWRMDNRAPQVVGDFDRYLSAGGTTTLFRWGWGSDCDSVSLNNPVATTGSYTTTNSKNQLTGSFSGGMAPVASGGDNRRCLRAVQGWSQRDKVLSMGGRTFDISTSYLATLPASGTWFASGPDLVATAGSAAPAVGTQNVWRATVSVPFPGAVVPTGNFADNPACQPSGAGDLNVFWGWPTARDSTTAPLLGGIDPTPAMGAGSWEGWVRPRNGGSAAWRQIGGGTMVGWHRGDKFTSNDLTYANYSTPGWYEILMVAYPHSSGYGQANSQMYSAATFFINVYQKDTATWYCAHDSRALGLAGNIGNTTANNETTGRFSPGAHGFVNVEGKSIDAELSQAVP